MRAVSRKAIVTWALVVLALAFDVGMLYAYFRLMGTLEKIKFLLSGGCQ